MSEPRQDGNKPRDRHSANFPTTGHPDIEPAGTSEVDEPPGKDDLEPSAFPDSFRPKSPPKKKDRDERERGHGVESEWEPPQA